MQEDTFVILKLCIHIATTKKDTQAKFILAHSRLYVLLLIGKCSLIGKQMC